MFTLFTKGVSVGNETLQTSRINKNCEAYNTTFHEMPVKMLINEAIFHKYTSALKYRILKKPDVLAKKPSSHFGIHPLGNMHSGKDIVVKLS